MTFSRWFMIILVILLLALIVAAPELVLYFIAILWPPGVVS